MQTLQKLLREGRLRFSTLSTDFSTINGEYSPRAVENPRLSPFQHFSHNTKWIIHNPQTRTAIAFCGLFHRIHGPYYYYYPRFLSLQSKINSAPQKAHPSRENFLPSLPIKTDKKLSTPAKQVVRAGLQSPTRAEVPAQTLISGRRGRPEPAKSCPGPGNFRHRRVRRNKNPYCLAWTSIAKNGTQNLASLFHITKSDRKTTPASIFHSL